MAYTTLLFDLDHTLLDSAASERRAFAQAMDVAGIAEPTRYFDTYVSINRDLWAAVERSELHPDDVKELRFRRLLAATDIEADVTTLASAYVSGLGDHGELYPGTKAVLDALAPHAAMALITNGIGSVQRARIHRLGLAGYFDAIAISGEIGFSKPGIEIFTCVFEQLGNPDPGSAVIVGDSLTSDMQGGRNFGIATCWFNPTGVPRPVNVPIDHQISALRELIPLVAATQASS